MKIYLNEKSPFGTGNLCLIGIEFKKYPGMVFGIYHLGAENMFKRWDR